MEVQVELSGGLELLFSGQKRLRISLPEGASMRQVIFRVKEQLRERPEHFMTGSSL